MKASRRRLLVEQDVQLGLAGRIILQWAALLATMVCVLPLIRAIVLMDVETPPWERVRGVGVDAAIMGIVFLLLLPYFLYDTLKVTNRFAGPMYRLKMTCRALAEGAEYRPLKFRKDDYWHDVADQFNAMMARYEPRRSAGEAAEADPESAELVCSGSERVA